MKELNAYQNNPQHGPMTIVLRFDGRIIYLKSSDAPQKNQMVAQLKAGGAAIKESHSGWLKIDMFNVHKLARFGEQEIDVDAMLPETIEEKLVDFYKNKYEQAHFEVTIKQL